MEDKFFYISLSIITLLFLIILRSKFKFQTSSKVPPGPWKLPLIGNLHQLASISALPHRTLRDLSRQHGPVMTLQLGEVMSVVISSPEAAKEVFQTHDLVFAQRPLTFVSKAIVFDHPGIVSSPCGDYWRQMRKICVTQLLAPRIVKSFRSVREEQVSILVDSVSSSIGQPVNFSKMSASMTSAVIYRAVLGKRKDANCTRQDELESCLKSLFALSVGFDLPDCFPSIKFLSSLTGLKGKIQRIRMKLFAILDEIVRDHEMKAKSTTSTADEDHEDDLVDVLLKFLENHKSSGVKFEFTMNHVKLVVLEMLAAGSETTGNTLEWAMAEMMKNPKTLAKAQAEARQVLGAKPEIKEDEERIQKLEYLKCVVKETLRLHSPAPLIGRESSEGCEILGFEIPRNTLVVVNAWAIGREPSVWAEADRFVPERFMGMGPSADIKGTCMEYVPFGGGRRVCPGIMFAGASVELALAHLLCHFDWELPNGEVDMCEGFGGIARRKHDLYVVPTSPY